MYSAGDDDDFFTPTASTSSHLASLFGVGLSAPATPDSSPSLIYTAPKQPKLPENEQSKPKPRPQNKVISAKTIQLHKFDGTSFGIIGKHGIAVIGDPDVNSYNLLVYKTQQNIVTATAISAALIYTHNGQDRSASFRDNQNNLWRVHFETAKDDLEFLSVMEAKGASVVAAVQAAQESQAPPERDATLSDGSQARADILERISKVGQSMLPTVKNPDLSESEPDEIVKTKKVVRKPKRHSTSEKDLHTMELSEPSQQFMVPVSATAMHQPQYTLINGQYVPTQMVPQMMAIGDPFSIHFAENRTHNSEVRINLSQLSTKLDSVLNEMGSMRTPPETSALHSRIDELEKKLAGLTDARKVDTAPDARDEQIKMLQDEVTAARDELAQAYAINADLQGTIERLNRQIDTQNSELDRLRQAGDLEATVDELRLKIQELEGFRLENENHKRTVEGLNQTVGKLQLSLEAQNAALSESHSVVERLQESKKLLEENVANQQLKLVDIEEQYKETQSTDKLEAERVNEDKAKAFAEMVKDSMNTMYQNILGKCSEEDGTYNFKKTLSQHMKSTTFHIIDEYKNSIADADAFRRNDEAIMSDSAPPPVPEFEVTV